MKTIEEVIGADATAELKERYGRLVNWIFVEEPEPGVFGMRFQIADWKRMSAKPGDNEIKKRTIGLGVAEIEHELYSLLNFDGTAVETGMHLNYNLPKNGVHMHPKIYADLMSTVTKSMKIIDERLEQLKNGGCV